MDDSQYGATVVISHRVKDGKQAEYDAWLDEIGPVCKSYPGYLDIQVIRPVPGLTGTSTVVIRFDNHEHLKNWIESDDRNRLIAKIRPIFAEDDEFHIRSGLDFWFTPDGASVPAAARWKQWFITWSALYPTSLIGTWLFKPVLIKLGIVDHYTEIFVMQGIVVAAMVYLVMPRYTRFVSRWLFKS